MTSIDGLRSCAEGVAVSPPPRGARGGGRAPGVPLAGKENPNLKNLLCDVAEPPVLGEEIISFVVGLNDTLLVALFGDEADGCFCSLCLLLGGLGVLVVGVVVGVTVTGEHSFTGLEAEAVGSASRGRFDESTTSLDILSCADS